MNCPNARGSLLSIPPKEGLGRACGLGRPWKNSQAPWASRKLTATKGSRLHPLWGETEGRLLGARSKVLHQPLVTPEF